MYVNRLLRRECGVAAFVLPGPGKSVARRQYGHKKRKMQYSGGSGSACDV